jgi:hypothetical protein
MHAKTPLSTHAKPFIPADFKHVQSVGAQMVAWFPIMIEMGPPAAAQHAKDAQSANSIKVSKVHRGRVESREGRSELPSRTPSPSGHSVCFSEVSTSLASCCTKEETLSDVSLSSDALQDMVADYPVATTIPTKNTFVHFSKDDVDMSAQAMLSKSSSAPAICLNHPFKVLVPPTPTELHERGECTPCAYFSLKADGCRRGDACMFCHLCPAEELFNRKRLKRKASKATKQAYKELEKVKPEANTIWYLS